MSGRRARPRWKSSPSTYRRALVTHGVHVLPAALAVSVAVIMTLPVALAVFFVAELVLFLVVPRLSTFRRSVDRCTEEAARIAEGIARAEVLSKMSDAHRNELERLEDLAERIRERGELDTEADAETAMERWLGLDRLIDLYIRLAVAHRRNSESFSTVERSALEDRIARLEHMPLAQLSEAARASVARRRAVLERRRETWTRALEEREVLAQELATISDAIRWMHELCATSGAGGPSARPYVAEALLSWESLGAKMGQGSGFEIDGALDGAARGVRVANDNAPRATRATAPSSERPSVDDDDEVIRVEAESV
jgi:hypothetical protein